MSEVVSDPASTAQGKFIVFIVITLLVSVNTRAAELKRGKCSERFVSCENGECIKRFDVCDGIANCSDGSDETQPICMEGGCPAKTFRCAYGACIDESLKCNGKHDCADQSDELSLSPSCGLQWLTNVSPPCRKDQFQCRNGECIPGDYMCDGEANCSDRSDESILACYGGKLSSCPLGSFRCAYGGCISATNICNSKDDCADGSDEHHLLCNRPKPQTVTPTKCDKGSFRCDDGACVDGTTRCDGKMDCADNSDEKHCSGSVTVVTRPRPPPPTTLTPTTHKPPPIPQEIPANSCPFPKLQPGTHFVSKWCACSNTSFVPNSDVLIMTCSQGYAPLHGDSYTFASCNNGALIPKEQRCVRLCSKLTGKHSVAYECTKDGVETSCDGTQRPGSKVKMTCQTGYYYPQNRTLREMIGTCGEDGIWSNVNHFDCTHDCGRLFKSPKPLISHGSNVSSISEYPWHAGIYSWNGTSWKQDCGGTIISAYFILTAAHCVNVKGVLREPSWLRIAVGKYFRNFEIQASEKSTAIILKVKTFYVPPSFNGENTNYESDIGIIQVVEPIRFSEAVKPACIINTNNRLHDLNGKFGHIVGWGSDENGKSTESLKSAMLPYIPYSTCLLLPNVTGYLARDKFCAYLDNGTRVLEGDSGGGLTFEFGGSHFVYGIVSVNIQNTIVSAFTDVSYPDSRNFINKHKINLDTELELSNTNNG